ncbi:remorin-like isoform X2 [Olea europaea var. sylvestris]|uniref:remorin-like isoform X2 n=1 Tax=Olea europaea var. sylvestris TaxID=158386 RepID=UPI000C1CD8CE|nr:remorin-like isoform X2 [Olea europaea var. sylvestris]
MATAATPEIVNQKPAVVETMTEPPLASVMEKPNDVGQDKSAIPPPPPDDSKATAVVDQSKHTSPDTSAAMKSSKGSRDRDIALAKVEDEKRLSFVKAWEDSEKSKVENKAQKKLSEVSSWENSKKASLEAQLRKIEEQLEKKKADYAEKVRNKVALIHKEAEEKRAMVEAKRGEEILKTDEMAAKYRATGHAPKKGFGCFGC